MAVTEVMITSYMNTKGLRHHSKLYCTVCQKYEDRICGKKHFLCAWITGLWVIKKLAKSWIIPSSALLLLIVLSITACNYMIIFTMYIDISVTEQCQTKIYLA